MFNRMHEDSKEKEDEKEDMQQDRLPHQIQVTVRLRQSRPYLRRNTSNIASSGIVVAGCTSSGIVVEQTGYDNAEQQKNAARKIRRKADSGQINLTLEEWNYLMSHIAEINEAIQAMPR